MNEHLLGQGIRFNDCVFTEPVRLADWVPPRFAGLIAVLVKDPNWAPKPFQPLWFGEFGNNAGHLFGTHRPPHADALFLSVLPMLFSTTDQRCAVRDRLVWAYNPALQSKHSAAAAPSEWAHKLHLLEKKHEEQTTELRMLLTDVARLIQPLPPSPRRRRIGFMTEPELEPSV